MRAVIRRLLLWTFICVVSAAPSFLFASHEFNHAAMIVGVCAFIAAYTAFTSTSWFNVLCRRPFVRRTLYIGYGTRLALSLLHGVAFAIAVSGRPTPWVFMLIDVWPGLLSVEIVRNLLAMETESFMGTLWTTLVQGVLLNMILLVFMLIVYLVQRLFIIPPPEQAPHGFDVILPAGPAAAPFEKAGRAG